LGKNSVVYISDAILHKHLWIVKQIPPPMSGHEMPNCEMLYIPFIIGKGLAEDEQ